MYNITRRIICRNSLKLRIAASRIHTVNNGDQHQQVTNGKISLRDFYRGKSVFLTGGSGFLGKVFIQKLLDMNGIDKIYVLIRDKKGYTIEQRVQEIVNNELFSKIKQTRPDDLKRIVPVAGDVSLPNLGLSDKDENLLKEKVSVVIHSAASVLFFEKLNVSMNINVEGTKKILELCKRINNLEAFVHISTAYANSDRKVADEVIYPAPRSIQEVYYFIKKGYTKQELTKFINGKPNTYSFTKSIAEKYIEENYGDIPTAIVRPSIVTPTAMAPLVGWLDNWGGVTRTGYDVAQGYSRIVNGSGKNILDLIPVDYCGNVTLAAAAKCPRTKKLTIYHSCSSSINPVTAGGFYENIKEETVKSGQNALPYPTILYVQSEANKKALTFLLQTVPAHVADYFLRLTGRTPKWVKQNDRVILYREAVKFFVMNEWVFIARNVSNLQEELTPEDQQLFPVSPHDVDWKAYLHEYSRGIRRHLVY